jgi:hypothetical protein
MNARGNAAVFSATSHCWSPYSQRYFSLGGIGSTSPSGRRGAMPNSSIWPLGQVYCTSMRVIGTWVGSWTTP